ncbi:MAG: hypothetical protein QRY74_04920 [Chlamydia sp.]
MTDLPSLPVSSIQANAPAKIILSGEHSVLYGGAAIAAAVNCCATTKIVADIGRDCHSQIFSKKLLSIRLEDMKTSISGTFSMFSRVKDRLIHSYKKFLTGKKSICTLFGNPSELFQFAMGSLIEACYLELKENLNINLSSSIPIGCGMGSSAATIVSFIHAVTHHFRIVKGSDWLEKMLLEVERLQHGYSSGLDTFVSLHGGLVQYEMGKKPTLFDTTSSEFLQSLPFWLIQTGKPESSTGECVQHVRKGAYGDTQSLLWRDFQSVTSGFLSAIKERNQSSLLELLSYNHGLLHTLGVVPDKVHSFVKKAESLGVYMKTTGAGAVRGLTGGVLLGLGQTPPTELLQEYGYAVPKSIKLAVPGVRLHI